MRENPSLASMRRWIKVTIAIYVFMGVTTAVNPLLKSKGAMMFWVILMVAFGLAVSYLVCYVGWPPNNDSKVEGGAVR